ncbi:MAG: SCO family protein [Candidatus Latescibacterota bacterium]|nr:MAG: SCO family protein [Candidatus Latescibacterota bacterium]
MRPRGSFTLVLFMAPLLIGSVAVAQEAVRHEVQPLPPEVGIDEKLGEYVPLELGFLDASGDSVYLHQVIDKPTVLTLVYYHCPTICMPLLEGVADVIDKTELDPGKDYNVLTVSFDQYDNPKTASQIRKNITTSMKKMLRPGAWRFLTADSSTIAALTGSVGFHVKRVDKDFAHGTSLIVLSPKGKIVRYLYGLSYMPFDLKMAVTEATEGKVVPSIARVLQFCFSYDPDGRRYVFNVTRVVGATVILVVFGYVLFISTVGRSRRKEKRA